MRKNIAIYVSGSILNYNILHDKPNFIDILNELNNRYNIYLFLSINPNAYPKNINILDEINKVKKVLSKFLIKIDIIEYKIPKSYANLRKKNNIKFDYLNYNQYNQLSRLFHDVNNFKNIEIYEKENILEFDVYCSMRCDFEMITPISLINFEIEENICYTLKCGSIYWGHIYRDNPSMINDMFVYGCKNTMKIHSNTYGWLLKNNELYNGKYINASETLMTDCVLNHCFYKDTPGGGHNPKMTKEEIITIYKNSKIKIKFLENIEVKLLKNTLRHKYNFEVNLENIDMYTE
jgi:hypothetical protein